MNEGLAQAHRALAIFYVAIFILACVAFGVENPNALKADFGFFALFFGVLVGLHFAASRGVEHSQWWARAISITLGTVLLVGFPIGTAIGGYLLYLAVGTWERPQSGAA